MPNWDVMIYDGYIIREQGANAIQELAIILSIHIALTKHIIRAGIPLDYYINRVRFKFNVHNDFFEEIAKFRAFRKLWAKINRDRFGYKGPSPTRFTVQTAGSTLTAQQPLNNIVRVALQAMAGIIAGCTSLHIASYDEALSLPSEEAVEVAIRTIQILYHETNVRNVTDPIGGSYYVEYLTSQIEQEVFKMLDEIEDQGGFLKCWEIGWFRNRIEEEAYKWEEAVAKEEKVVVGVNKYIKGEETQVPVFKVDPQVGKIAVERVKKFKNARDNKRVKECLDSVREVAKTDGDLMQALIEAARADATLGEMMDVLKEVYGWHVQS